MFSLSVVQLKIFFSFILFCFALSNSQSSLPSVCNCVNYPCQMQMHGTLCALFFPLCIQLHSKRESRCKGEASSTQGRWQYFPTQVCTCTCRIHCRAQKTQSERSVIIYITGLCTFVLLKDRIRHKMRYTWIDKGSSVNYTSAAMNRNFIYNQSANQNVKKFTQRIYIFSSRFVRAFQIFR